MLTQLAQFKPARVSLLLAFSIFFAIGISAPQAQAQRIARRYYTNEHDGFRFKPIDDLDATPVPPNERAAGLISRMEGKAARIWVYSIGDGDAGEAEEGRTSAAKRRADPARLLTRKIADFGQHWKKPSLTESVEVKKLTADLRVWEDVGGSYVELWQFHLDHTDISIAYVIQASIVDKTWKKGLRKSASTFEPIKRKNSAVAEEGAKKDYKTMLAEAQVLAEQVEGWQALPTPSERFIILTSATKRNFIKEVVTRLEASRDVYERDFPPPKAFDHVSIVRICGSETEFHRYGNTGRGVAGWFNPSSTELVLYDAVEIDRNMTYAVVSHEAFHQYCHFLFGESEAHRWFDEGHGDYYGGIKLSAGRAKITPQMPSGLDRLQVIREMVREGTYKPVSDHINYDHRQWQTQGPSNVSCYAQSWSIIYFLRMGALGKVSRKVWKKEYADIIPNYVSTLSTGFSTAYEKTRSEREKKAKAEGRELTADEAKVNRMDLRGGAKGEIWREAMDASWGQIDIDQFEEDWILYVEKYLK